MNRRSDVVVIGGGIVGLWTAWHLQRHGCAVTVLERDRIGSGASSGNCGYICPSHVHPLSGPGAVLGGLRMMIRSGGALSIPPRWDPGLWHWLMKFALKCNKNDFRRASVGRHELLQSSRGLYQDFANDHSEAIGWQEKGLLLVYRSDREFEGYESKVAELRNDFGLEIDRYDSAQLCQFEPTLREGLAGGWHFTKDAHLVPSGLLGELRRQILRDGGTIRERTNVASFSIQGGEVRDARTESGEEFHADAFVLTTGAEASQLGKILGCRIPVVPGKGYSITFDERDGMPTTPMIFEDDHVAVTPLGDSFRVGSTMQLTGFDRSIPESRIEMLMRSAREHIRNPLPTSRGGRWSGWRPMMPDGLPCIDQTPVASNAFVAAGNGMIGVASGPATGKLIAELTLGVTPHIDPSPYRLGRFVKAATTSVVASGVTTTKPEVDAAGDVASVDL